jgi:hypothetical protein
MLVNACATVLKLPALNFPHEFHGQRDEHDPKLQTHLHGFAGFVMSGGARPMTQTRYHVLQHLRRVRHHVSFEVDEDQFEALTSWSSSANALLFLVDGSVRDPFGRVLVDPQSGDPEQDAEVPYPADARARKHRTQGTLQKRSIPFATGLPPVVSRFEVALRAPADVIHRAIALLCVAVRAESLGQGDPIDSVAIMERLSEASGALSPAEVAFLGKDAPEQQEIVNFVWRYEALWVLEWDLGRGNLRRARGSGCTT